MKKVKEKLYTLDEALDQMLYYDHDEFLNQVAKEEGKKVGLEEGRIEGRKVGRKEGREEGLKEGINLVAKEMLANHMKMEDIIKYTKLTKEEIENL